MPFLNDDYDYYYDETINNIPEVMEKTTTTTVRPTQRWLTDRESFTMADAKPPVMQTTWRPLQFNQFLSSTSESSPFEPVRSREVPTVRTTTVSTTMAYRYKKPEEVTISTEIPCDLKDLCDVTEKNYPL